VVKLVRGGRVAMTFCEVLEQVLALLQRYGRVSYRTLKRQCDLDDEFILNREHKGWISHRDYGYRGAW